MSEVLEGGCVCGAIRYRTRGRPERTTVCHCTFCQRISGSAFAIWSVLRQENVEICGAAPAIYEHRSDESGRWIRLEFCARCGTTIGSTFERGPGLYALAAGTFDDPTSLRVERHVWTRSAQPWVVIPAHVACFDQQFVQHPDQPAVTSRPSS